jgi:transposase-like protein
VPLALRSCSEEVETALCDWSRAAAKEVLAELWEADVERLCGERWKPRPRSKVTRAGWCKSDITLGRQRVEVRRPRVRSVQGKEIELPTFKAASRRDLLDRSALEDVTASVTTGSFPRDRFPRERIPEEFVDQLASRLGAEHAVPKGAFDTGLLIAPIDFPDQSFLGAVGIDASARRRIVGLRAGAVDSEENVRGLVDEVIARHSGQAPPAVFIVGEVPMLVTALTERFGRSILIQRCQHEKRRRVLGLLPPAQQPPTLEALLDAYASEDAKTAKRALQKTLRSLEASHPGAADALRDALDDTLTLQRLGVAKPHGRADAGKSTVSPEA